MTYSAEVATNASLPETKVPDVPTIQTDDPKLRQFIDAVREIIQVREGKRGNPLDANVTYRDLIEAGLAAATTATEGGAGAAGGNGSPGGGVGIGPPTSYCSTNFETPPPPTSLAATGGFATILLSWGQQGFPCIAYTEIWRAAGIAGGDPGIGAAQLVATTAAQMFSDTVGNAATYYYWVRNVSQTGVIGPYNAVQGTMGVTSLDPGYALQVLSGQIANSSLNTALGTTITSLVGQAATTGSAITTLQTTQTTQATSITNIQTAQVNTPRVFFQTSAPADPFSGIALKAGDIWYDTDDNNRSYKWTGTWTEYVNAAKVYWQASQPSGGTYFVGDLWYDSDDNNKPYRFNGTGWDVLRDGYIDARVTTLEQTKIGYASWTAAASAGTGFGGVAHAIGEPFDNSGAITDAAGVTSWNSGHTSPNLLQWNIGLPLAYSVKQVAVNDGSGSVQLEQKFVAQKTTNDTLMGQYTVKIDSNGYVTGFGLASTTTTAQPYSEFEVRADSFSIAPAGAPAWSSGTTYAALATVSYSGRIYQSIAGGNLNHTPVAGGTTYWNDLTTVLPFVVTTASQVINGITYPAGVWMNSAMIADATITSAKIGSLNADIINNTSFMQSPKIWGAKLYINDEAVFAPNGQFSTTTSGGKVTGVTFSGFGATGQGLWLRDVAGTYTADFQGTLKSPNFATGSGSTFGTGWALYSNGNLELNNVVARGTIYATAGSFAGSLSAATGTFAGSLSAATGTFAGSLSAATGTFAGALSAATGSFSGAVTATSGTIGGLTITSGAMYSGLYWSSGWTGKGFYFDNVPHMMLGDSAGKNIYFDGTTLSINGDLVVTGNIVNDAITNTDTGAGTCAFTNWSASYPQAAVDDGSTGTTVVQAVVTGAMYPIPAGTTITAAIHQFVSGTTWTQVGSSSTVLVGDGTVVLGYTIPVLYRGLHQGSKLYCITCTDGNASGTIVATASKK